MFQITAVIVNRKENKLKKGGGYHLDIFVLSLQIFVVGLLGDYETEKHKAKSHFRLTNLRGRYCARAEPRELVESGERVVGAG